MPGKTARGPSPIPTSGRRGISPFRNRGISPFRRNRSSSVDSAASSSSDEDKLQSGSGHHKHHHHNHHRQGRTQNVVVCHQTARSIVFRDSVRRATRIIDEVEREDEEEDDAINEKDQKEEKKSNADDSKDDDDDDDNSSSSSLLLDSGKLKSEASRLHTSSTRACEFIQDEIRSLLVEEAQEMIPEEAADIITSLRGNQFSERNVEIEGQDHLHLKPLPPLELGPNDEFEPLLEQEPSQLAGQADWLASERIVYNLLKDQKACVKMIKNSEWSSFLQRFQQPHVAAKTTRKYPNQHDDIGPHDGYNLNSFVTSTSLLPPLGRKMKSYGSLHAYQCGVVFALPEPSNTETEEEAVRRTETWAWPAGYAAKTEHNIDLRTGKLINGRQEALVSLDTIRQHNRDYLEKKDHVIGGKLVEGGFTVIPYNEVFLRVGGTTRTLSEDLDENCNNQHVAGRMRTFDKGCGVFVALFVRTITIRDIMVLFRTRARIGHVLGQEYVKNMPLLYLSHEHGVRVFTEKLQQQFFQLIAHKVQPFQNPTLETQIKFDGTNESCMQQKLEELIDLDDGLLEALTPEQCARIAGGFGCTDDTVANVLKKSKLQDEKKRNGGHKLQDVVVEGMASAVRSGDYFTARQLLILYTLVSSEQYPNESADQKSDGKGHISCVLHDSASLFSDLTLLDVQNINQLALGSEIVPPPPPLDTDRLRRSTTAFGLLSVFGAAQILRAMKDGSAKQRTEESIEAVEEWVKYGEESLAFRLASWREQRADEQNVAVETNSQFMAFASGKAISNRKRFAEQLKAALSHADFSGIQFLWGINKVVASMHSPCLRLEILHYILGLDNRYSVLHVERSIELAATCLRVGHT